MFEKNLYLTQIVIKLQVCPPLRGQGLSSIFYISINEQRFESLRAITN